MYRIKGKVMEDLEQKEIRFREWVGLAEGIPAVILTILVGIAFSICLIHSGAHFVSWTWDNGAPLRSGAIALMLGFMWVVGFLTTKDK